MPFKTKRALFSKNLPPWWFLPLLFLNVFVIYTLTLNPSLFRNDSPETITACVTLGVSHPPGYPLHSLLGHIFSWIKIGNPAMNLNFFSAVLAALGACLFSLNVWFLGNRLITDLKTSYLLVVNFIGSFCFALSKSYWSTALAAKGGIYTLQVVLELGLLLYLQLILRKPTSPKTAYFFTFLFSLGLLNHWPTHTLLIPPAILVVFTFWQKKPLKVIRDFRRNHILISISILITTLSLYLYLPLRSHLNPTLNFGTPSSFQSLISSLSRANYFKRETLISFMPTAISTIEDKSIYISNRFENEFSVWFSLFSIVGVFTLWRRGLSKVLLFILFLLLTTTLASLLYLQVSPIEFWHMDDHLLTDNWAISFLAVVGIWGFLSKTRSNDTFKFLILSFLFLLPVLSLFKSLVPNNQSREFLYRGYGMEALRSMSRNARYFAESDYDYFSILYFQEIEGRRKDIDTTLTTFMSEIDWIRLVRETTAKRVARQPIYCAFPNGDFINGCLKHSTTVAFKPTGTIIEFMPTSGALTNAPNTQPLDELWERYIVPSKPTPNSINGFLLELCAHPYINMANYLRFRHDMRHWDAYYQKALFLIQDPLWHEETARQLKEEHLLQVK